MRYFARVFFAFAFLLGTVGTTSAQATTYEGGAFTVSFLRVTSPYVYVSLSPAPAVCQGGTNYNEHLILNLDNPHSAEIYSALLSAYMSGTKLSGIWFEEFTGPCSTGNNVPHLTQIRFEPK